MGASENEWLHVAKKANIYIEQLRHADITSVIGAVAFRKQLQITKENTDVCQGSPRTSKINKSRDLETQQHDKTQNSNVIMN